MADPILEDAAEENFPFGDFLVPCDSTLIGFLHSAIMGVPIPVDPLPYYDIFSAPSPLRLIPRNRRNNPQMTHEWYCFWNRKMGGKIIKTSVGFYQFSARAVVYHVLDTDVTMGFSRTFDFYMGNPSDETHHYTIWRVEEFKINPNIVQVDDDDLAAKRRVSNLVVYKIVRSNDKKLKYPYGYGFEFTDSLLLTFLKRTIQGLDLPGHPIPVDIDVYSYASPEDLPFELCKRSRLDEWHFIRRTDEINFLTRDGFYEMTILQPIYVEIAKNEFILRGYKRTLDFYIRRPPAYAAIKSAWSIIEYQVDPSFIEEWDRRDFVLCKVVNRDSDEEIFAPIGERHWT
ncbi:uncharacterized protein LOC126678168 [Mercurialis annua]|uniref:uncharacterized protein LOC126678168 n=1 Tax=Mercurialis annua TaxID=3986 RepID=UPI00215F8151|nr:uncharacterized protein LOC126678168 [Mercurialis annua]